jgi:hypothetical protein
MSGFEPIILEWKETEYTVPAHKCMGLLAAIEQVLAPDQNSSAIEILAQPHRAHLTKLARAHATALRYAGCPVTDEMVYLSLQRDVAKGGAEGFEALKTLGDALLIMFFPDWARDDDADTASGNAPAAKEEQTPSPMASSGASMN